MERSTAPHAEAGTLDTSVTLHLRWAIRRNQGPEQRNGKQTLLSSVNLAAVRGIVERTFVTFADASDTSDDQPMTPHAIATRCPLGGHLRRDRSD